MDNTGTDQSVAMKTVTKLLLSAEHYASISPALARFYIAEVERLKKKLCLPRSSVSQICPRCHTIRRPDNCTQHLLSKMKSSQQIRRLKRKNADGRRVRRLGKFGKLLMDLHSAGANRLRIRCHSCGKQTFVPGACRPAAVPKADVAAGRAEMVKKKNKMKKIQSDESNTKAADISSVGRKTEEIGLKKCQHQTPLHSDCHEKSKVTNKKETLKRKHNMLQNILKQKSNSASLDTSATLRSFLKSL